MSAPAADRRLEPAVWFVSVGYAVAVCIHAYRSSYFYADDFEHFQLASRTPLGAYVWMLIDIHFVPLHRLCNWLLQRFAPLNFGLALGTLYLLHVLTLWRLRALLDYLVPSTANRLWMFLFAASPFLTITFLWWSAAVHRVPYLLFSIVAIEAGLRFADTGRLRPIATFFIATIGALGFYVKAALIPGYVVTIALVRFLVRTEDQPRLPAFPTALRRLAILALPVLALAGAAYVHAASSGPARTLNLRLSLVPDATVAAIQVLLHAVFLQVERDATRVFDWPVVGFWTVVVVGSILLRPRCAIVWLLGATWIAFEAFLIVASQRGVSWGLHVLNVHRYYEEMTLPFVLCLCLVWGCVRRSPFALPPSALWSRPAVRVLAVVCLVAYAGRSLALAVELTESVYQVHPVTHRQLRGLLREIDTLQVRGQPFSILDRPLPAVLFTTLTLRSMLSLVGIHVDSNLLDVDLYELTESGELKAVIPTERTEIFPGSNLPEQPAFHGIALGNQACFSVAGPGLGVFDATVPPVLLSRAALVIDGAEGPGELSVFYRGSVEPTFHNLRRHIVVLPDTRSRILIPLNPSFANRPSEVAAVRIELEPRPAPYCFARVTLVEY